MFTIVAAGFVRWKSRNILNNAFFQKSKISQETIVTPSPLLPWRTLGCYDGRPKYVVHVKRTVYKTLRFISC